MDKSTAERWVTISAVLVAGVYAYRRLTEGAGNPVVSFKNLVGIGQLPNLGVFVTAWGFMFLVISIMAEAAPGLGGGFAILVATGDLLTNSSSVFADVGKQTGTSSSSTTAQAPPATVAGEAPTTSTLATAGLVHGAGTITPTTPVTH